MYLLVKGYLLLVAVFPALQTVHGGYMVSVRIFQYINQNGTSFEQNSIKRRCCDGPPRDSCQTGDKCDTFFDICVGKIINNQCKGAFFQTRSAKDTNYFQNLSAMIAMSQENWVADSMSILIFVLDDDSNGTVRMHDHIDTMGEKLPSIIPAISESESIEYKISFRQQTVLNIYMRVWCADNFYGYECAVYCQDIAPVSKCNNVGVLQCLDENANTIERILIEVSTLRKDNYQNLLFEIKQLADYAFCENRTSITSVIPDFKSRTVSFMLTCNGIPILPIAMESKVRLLNNYTLMNFFHHKVDFGSSIKPQGYGQHGEPNVFVSVEVLEYANPAGRSFVGTNTTGGRRCCDIELASNCTLNDLCDTTISICIGRLTESGCTGAFMETPVYMNTNTLTTCGSVLLDRTTQQTFIQHPMIGATRITTKTTTIFAMVRDFDLEKKGFDLIDGLTKEINVTVSHNLNAARNVEVNMNNFIVLKLKIIFWCASGYEGEHCTTATGNFTCDPGWAGDGCDDKDECNSNPCLHGKCQNTIGSFICNCDESWSGPLCQTFHYCWLNPCHHGICNQLDAGGYNCVCDPGYTGYNCSLNINDCVSHSCMNNATCIDGVNNFTCACLPGFVGNLCENNICENVSCSGNNGVCQSLSGHDVRGFECACKKGWTGLFCERDENECLELVCKHNSTCINFNGSFSCSCSKFWTGEQCEVDIDECSSNPCKNHGTCHNQIGTTFTCTCDNGWTGSDCSVNINECIHNPNTCLYGKCVDIPGSYQCECDNGWIGENCSKDKNECQENLNICWKGNCINYSGGYNCTCYSGFRGKNCSDDVDECLVVSCTNGKCMNFPGGYSCICDKGFKGTHCEHDVDECTENPCKNNARCTNFPGDFNCTCSFGWAGRNCTTPSDRFAGKCHELQVKFSHVIQHSLENKVNGSIQTFMNMSVCHPAEMDTSVISINETYIRFKTTCGGICVTESQLKTALQSLSTFDKLTRFPIALADIKQPSTGNGNSGPLNQVWVPILIGCLIVFSITVAIGGILRKRKKIRFDERKEESHTILDNLQFENPSYVNSGGNYVKFGEMDSH